MRVLYNIYQLTAPSPAEKAALEQVMRPRTLEKGEYFLREAEVCKTLAFIESGSVRSFYQAGDKEICKEFLFENGIIGSVAGFLLQIPACLNVVALETTEILTLPYGPTMALLQQYPVWQKLGGIIMQEQLLRAEKREASLLKDAPEERFRALVAEHPKVFKRVPLQFIASYLGITRETLSRYRRKAHK